MHCDLGITINEAIKERKGGFIMATRLLVTGKYINRSTYVLYKEDILVGYRWHDTKKIAPLFPFGYGLTYTKFEYGKMSTDKETYAKDDTIKVVFELKNVGDVSGAEAVQLYVGQRKPQLERPKKELKAFDKIYLAQGETKKVELFIPVKELAYFDDRIQEWVVDSDQFILYSAASASEIKSSVKVNVK